MLTEIYEAIHFKPISQREASLMHEDILPALLQGCHLSVQSVHTQVELRGLGVCKQIDDIPEAELDSEEAVQWNAASMLCLKDTSVASTFITVQVSLTDLNRVDYTLAVCVKLNDGFVPDFAIPKLVTKDVNPILMSYKRKAVAPVLHG